MIHIFTLEDYTFTVTEGMENKVKIHSFVKLYS